MNTLRLARKRVCQLSLLVICSFAANAQYVIDSWTSESGLPQNSVLSIQQAADGYLWFTTVDGLVRFDGVRFTIFDRRNTPGLTSNRFASLLAEHDGTLWAATQDGGLIRYREGRFQAFTTADGLASDTILDVQRDLDGSLLIGTNSGLSHLAGGRITSDSPSDFRQHKTYVSARGARWDLDCTELRLTLGGHETHYKLPFNPHHVSLDQGYNFPYFAQMDETADASLWLAVTGGLYRLKDGKVTTWGRSKGMPQSSVVTLTHDRQGDVWIGTKTDGLCRFDGERFDCYTTVNGLSANYVTSIYQDREGSIWVGTGNRGLNRLTRRVVTPLSTADGLPHKNVYPIFQDRAGDVWLGVGETLVRTRVGRVIKVFRRAGDRLNGDIQCLYEDRMGRLWIGSVSRIEYFWNGRFTDFTANLKTGGGAFEYWFVYEDRAGALWFGTGAGLLRYQGGQVRRYTTMDGLPSNLVLAVQETRDGTLWFGTRGGLARLDGARFIAYTERDGLASNYVRSIHEDAQGILWLGTYDGGLSRMRNGAFTNYTTATGLFSNGVFKILEDSRGNFWMSSNQGIYRVGRQQLEDFAAAKISNIVSTAFGESDGMLNIECNGGRQQAGVRTRDGKLWFATQDGAAIIDPETLPYNKLPPPVLIEAGRVQGRNLRLPGAVQLMPNERNLEIRYTGLSFVKPELVRFRYRLEGLDTGWTEAGTRRVAFYPYLPPGRYVFHVIAANSDLFWNTQGASLPILVLPPYYRTWWFLSLACLFGVGTATLAWNRRVAQLQRESATRQAFSHRLLESQENERKRMAVELHDSLGQHLLIIKNRADLGLRCEDDRKRMKEQLDQITELAISAIAEVRQIAYNLRPLYLERLGLTAVIEEMIEKISSASGIEFASDIAPLDSMVSPDGAINLYRAIQESINNIVKHGKATKANVEVWRVGDEVQVTIADNGCGFNTDAPARRGLGLTSIAERVEMLGGTHTITSSPGQGVTISLRFPAAKGGANGI